MYPHRRRQRPAGDGAGGAARRARCTLTRSRRAVAPRQHGPRQRRRTRRALSQINCDYAILALPADAAAADADHAGAAGAAARGDRAPEAYGRATRTLLQLPTPVLARRGTAARVRLAAAVRRGLGSATRSSAAAPAHPHACSPAAAPATPTQAIVAKHGVARPGRMRSTGSARTAELLASRARSCGSRIRLRGGGALLRSRLRPVAARSGSRGPPAACFSPASTPASGGRAT